MLGKLIKYEWKHTYKAGLVLFSALAMVTLIGCLTFQAPMWKMDSPFQDGFSVFLLNMISVASLLLYIFLLVGALWSVLIYLTVRFYRTMYSKEGYLLHTLPVTKNQILVSKILVGSIWIFLVYLGVFFSLIIFGFTLVSALSGESVFSLMNGFMKGLSELLAQLSGMRISMDQGVVARVVFYLVDLILAAPAGLIMLFGAVSMGQLFSRHRVLMAFLSYMGIALVRWLFSTALQGVFYLGSETLGSAEWLFAYFDTGLIISLIKQIVLAVLCYLACYFINSRKLNLE